MTIPPSSGVFEIFSSIRSDGILPHSQLNTSVNASIEGSLSREPVQFFMLKYHRDRMLNAATAFHWDTSPLEGSKAFAELLNILHDHLEREYGDRNYGAPLKVRLDLILEDPGISDTESQLRIALSANGKFTVTSNGPHPGPAGIERSLVLPRDDAVSELYPGSLSSIADSPAYLRWRVFVSLEKVTPTLFTMHKTSNRGIYQKALDAVPAQRSDHIHNNDGLMKEVLIVNNSKEEEIMEGCITTPYFMRNGEWITPKLSCGGNRGTTRRWAVERGLCKPGVVELSSVKHGEIIVLSNGVKGFQSGTVVSGTSFLCEDTK